MTATIHYLPARPVESPAAFSPAWPASDLAACTCRPDTGFEIDPRRHNAPLDAHFMLRRLRRMQAEDAACAD